MDCLFCSIIKGEIPSTKVYENEKVFAFRDINPQAPTHILVVPKNHISSADAVNADNSADVAAIFEAIPEIAKAEGLKDGYRVITKIGEHGCQSVKHLHFHVVGGKQLSEADAMVDPREFKRLEAMVLSMTPHERANPDSIDFARRKRIAKGCGLPLEKIAGYIRQFNQMRKMMKKGGLMKSLMSGAGAMPGSMPSAGGFNPFGGGTPAISKKEQEKKKRLAKLKKKEKQKQRRKK